MSMEALTAFRSEDKSTGGARLCLMILCDMVNHENVCWPGHELLARRCNVQSTDTIGRYLSKLETLGLIVNLQKKDQGKHGSLGYYLPWVSQPGKSVGSTPQNGRVNTADPSPCEAGQHRRSVGSTPQIGRVNTANQTVNTADPSSPIIREANKPLKTIEDQSAPPPVELPDSFPSTEAIALQWALAKFPDDFVIDEWLQAHARGGCDQKQVPIKSWPSYLAIRWKWHQASGPEKSGGARQQLSASMRAVRIRELETELEHHVANPRRDMTVAPDQRADYQRLRFELHQLQNQ